MCPLEHDDNAGGNLRADYQLPALVSRPAIYLPWVAVASRRWSTQGTPPHRHTKKMPEKSTAAVSVPSARRERRRPQPCFGVRAQWAACEPDHEPATRVVARRTCAHRVTTPNQAIPNQAIPNQLYSLTICPPMCDILPYRFLELSYFGVRTRRTKSK